MEERGIKREGGFEDGRKHASWFFTSRSFSKECTDVESSSMTNTVCLVDQTSKCNVSLDAEDVGHFRE